MNRATLIPLLAVACVLTQCASGPQLDRAVTLEPADKVVVVYRQPDKSFQQTLFTETVASKSEFYGDPRSDQLAKILSTGGMQVLLDGLATNGYFAHAVSEASPRGTGEILVTINERRYAFTSAQAAATAEKQEVYRQSLATFLNIYNYTQSYHVSRGDDAVAEEHRRREAQAELYFRTKSGKGNQ